LKFVLKVGWGDKWDQFIEEGDRPKPDFLKSRCARLVAKMGEEVKQHRHKHHSEAKHKSKKPAKPPKLPKKKPEPIVEVDLLGSPMGRIVTNLRYFGEPESDADWDNFASLCESDDLREIVPLVFAGAQALLADPQGEPEDLFRDCPDLIGVMTVKRAESIVNSANWFRRFRSFFPARFTLDRDLTPVPDWWDHAAFDLPLFEHLAKCGFARPCVLLAREPFFALVPEKLRSKVQNGAEKQSRVKVKVENLALLLSKRDLKFHVDAIMNEMVAEVIPGIVITLKPQEMRPPDLPKIIGDVLIQSLGDGQFAAINGYLYRPGFYAKSRYNGKAYVCTISEDAFAPFEIANEDGSKFAGASPPEVWERVLPDGINQDAFELFAIGLPPVRFWLQKKLGNARVMGYKPIKFEAEKDEIKLSGGGMSFMSRVGRPSPKPF
jgi:hypothetical protein